MGGDLRMIDGPALVRQLKRHALFNRFVRIGEWITDQVFDYGIVPQADHLRTQLACKNYDIEKGYSLTIN